MDTWLTLLYKFFELDIKTTIALLTWGNLMLFILPISYQVARSSKENRMQLLWFSLSKFSQTLAWAMIYLRGDIPDWISVSFGNTLLYTGIYLEALMMLSMIKHKSRKTYVGITGIYGMGILTFVIASSGGLTPNLRVALASLVVSSILIVPTVLYVFSKASSGFKRSLGFYYLLLIVILLIRGMKGYYDPATTIFSNTALQSITFMCMFLILIISGTGFLLLIKEDKDRKIEAMARIDELTDLFNRRHFLEEAHAVVERHRRFKAPLSILFLDIDRFKSINDTYGHSFGDEALKAFGRVLKSSVRIFDFVCRYGGDEFVILLSNTEKSDAVVVAERIRTSLSVLEFSSQPGFKLTTSIGIHTAVPSNEDTLEAMIAKSDQALYQAKSGGRDQTHMS